MADLEALTDGPRPYFYDHIPKLRELLKNGGLPGVKYAQVTVSNLRKAQDFGWNKLTGNQMTYTIGGPKGHVDCELRGMGTPIPGQSTDSGERVCLIDNEIFAATGHLTPDGDVLVRGDEEPEPGEGVVEVLSETNLPTPEPTPVDATIPVSEPTEAPREIG